MRTERDSLGEMQVPDDALYGAQTMRAVLNFPVSGQRLPAPFIRALALIKQANALYSATETDAPEAPWAAIAAAAADIAAGAHLDQFVVDVYQTGSGTSTNMNCNEVVAHLAAAASGQAVHPNDHVNRGQSSNDVFPAALHLAFLTETRDRLLPALQELAAALGRKEKEFADVIKIGRTHLQDATPVTLGQEFGGYRTQLENGIRRIGQAIEGLCELPLGGTAVGTRLNCPPARTRTVLAWLAGQTGFALREAPNHFEAQAARDAAVFFSGALKTLAVSLMKIANDIRWLGSGPRCGLGELQLPATQPGSSIMPGKVNPVQAEALAMVAARVLGNDSAITVAGGSGNFELNVMMPLIAACGLESVALLTGGVTSFRTRCIEGLTADRERCRELTERSLALVTALVPVLGYDRAAALAKEASSRGVTIRALLSAAGELSPEQIDALLDPASMCGDNF